MIKVKFEFQKRFALNAAKIGALKSYISIEDESKKDEWKHFDKGTVHLGSFKRRIPRKENPGSEDYTQSKTNESKRRDSENKTYTGILKIWIDTTNAEEANKFIYVVSSVLNNIENVDLEIIDCGIGSYWQNIWIKIRGWFAKEEVKQILTKSGQAVESYTLDRHIAPIEKAKAEKEKTTAETSLLMSKENAQKLHKIRIEKEEAELEALRLANLEKKIDLIGKLSETLSSGLVEIDSDYRIELNKLLLIKQEQGEVTTGDISDLDNYLEHSEEL